MPLSHFRMQASKAYINKPPKTSVRRVDSRREIPPALLPLLILPLLVYVALSLLSSLPLLQTASNWHLKIQFWRQGRSHRLGVRTRRGGCAPSPSPPLPPGAEADGRSVTPFCSSLPSFTCERNLSGPRASAEWMRQRGNYSSPAPSPFLLPFSAPIHRPCNG